MAIHIFKSADARCNETIKIWKGKMFRKYNLDAKPWILKNWKLVVTIVLGVALGHFLSGCYVGVRVHREDRTSLACMEPLLETEQKLAQELEKYANELQDKVNTIRSGLSRMRKANEIHGIDAEMFLGNPMNSFSMIRRLKHEWSAWENFLQKSVGRDHIKSIAHTINSLSDFDILEAVRDIEVLREIYDIQPKDWVQGNLSGNYYDTKLTALDAYTIAYSLHKRKMYAPADDWFMAALLVYEDRDMYNFLHFNRSFIYGLYVDNLLMQNRKDEALIVLNLSLQGDPNNPQLHRRKEIIESLDLRNVESPECKSESELQASIKRGCRGQYAANDSVELFCYYNSSSSDFARFAPFKVEELSTDPIVLLYHDVINHEEISSFKDIAGHQWKQHRGHPNRLSIFGNESEHVIDLNQRIEDMTGLQTSGGEPFEVANYGPGKLGPRQGSNCATNCPSSDGKLSICKPLMTVFIYLSNVEYGGAMVFPRIEVDSLPQKGSALIWYNLENDMEQCDSRVLHMACPVVVGSKWVAVKKINYVNQTFRKPCYRNGSDNFPSSSITN